MQLVNIDQYKKAIVNGERAFLFYIEKGSVWIIADMEIGGNTPRYRVELMDFKLNTFEPILYTTVECRTFYCGGISFNEYDEKIDDTFNLALKDFLALQNDAKYLICGNMDLYKISSMYDNQYLYIYVQ